jgi:hypothetical protein
MQPNGLFAQWTKIKVASGVTLFVASINALISC